MFTDKSVSGVDSLYRASLYVQPDCNRKGGSTALPKPLCCVVTCAIISRTFELAEESWVAREFCAGGPLVSSSRPVSYRSPNEAEFCDKSVECKTRSRNGRCAMRSTSRAHLIFFASFVALLSLVPLGMIPTQFRRGEVQTAEPPTAAAPPTTAPVDNPHAASTNIEVLNEKVNGLERDLQLQTDMYSASVARMESNMNVFIGVMTVASILLAVLGFGVVRVLDPASCRGAH